MPVNHFTTKFNMDSYSALIVLKLCSVVYELMSEERLSEVLNAGAALIQISPLFVVGLILELSLDTTLVAHHLVQKHSCRDLDAYFYIQKCALSMTCHGVPLSSERSRCSR